MHEMWHCNDSAYQDDYSTATDNEDDWREPNDQRLYSSTLRPDTVAHAMSSGRTAARCLQQEFDSEFDNTSLCESLNDSRPKSPAVNRSRSPKRKSSGSPPINLNINFEIPSVRNARQSSVPINLNISGFEEFDGTAVKDNCHRNSYRITDNTLTCPRSEKKTQSCIKRAKSPNDTSQYQLYQTPNTNLKNMQRWGANENLNYSSLSCNKSPNCSIRAVSPGSCFSKKASLYAYDNSNEKPDESTASPKCTAPCCGSNKEHSNCKAPCCAGHRSKSPCASKKQDSHSRMNKSISSCLKPCMSQKKSGASGCSLYKDDANMLSASITTLETYRGKEQVTGQTNLKVTYEDTQPTGQTKRSPSPSPRRLENYCQEKSQQRSRVSPKSCSSSSKRDSFKTYGNYANDSSYYYDCREYDDSRNATNLSCNPSRGKSSRTSTNYDEDESGYMYDCTNDFEDNSYQNCEMINCGTSAYSSGRDSSSRGSSPNNTTVIKLSFTGSGKLKAKSSNPRGPRQSRMVTSTPVSSTSQKRRLSSPQDSPICR